MLFSLATEIRSRGNSSPLQITTTRNKRTGDNFDMIFVLVVYRARLYSTQSIALLVHMYRVRQESIENLFIFTRRNEKL